MPNITLPRPLPHEQPMLRSTARFKLLFCGRRFGKSTIALDACIDGHGDKLEDGSPQYKGAAWGARIAWVAKDYKQAMEFWGKAKHATAGVGVVNESERTITFPAYQGRRGQLTVHTAVNADAMRGSEYDGAVLDEAAFFPRDVWHDALRPCLATTRGWTIFATTPAPAESGDAKNWFTAMYLDALRNRWPDYACWQRPTSDNPLVPPEELEEIRKTTPDVTFKREYLADYSATGDVLAFPEFRPFDADGRPFGVVPHAELPQAWKRYGGHDWGRVRGATLYAALQPADVTGSAHIIVYAEHDFHDLDPDDIASVALARAGGRVAAVWSDGIIWSNRLEGSGVITAQQREALADKGLLSNTIAEQYGRAGWNNLVASTARPLARKTAVHNALRVQADGWPGLLVMDNCPVTIDSLLNLQVDEHQPEVVQSTYHRDDRIQDHLYDALGHMLHGMGFPPQPKAERRPALPDTYSWR